MISFFSLLGFLFTALGFLGAHFRFLSPELGFYLALAGVLLMALMAFPQLAKLVRRRGEVSYLGLCLGLASLGALGWMVHLSLQSPLIDLTTNTAQPPQFEHVSPWIEVDDPNFLEPKYLVAKNYLAHSAEMQAKYFPALSGLAMKAPPEQAFAKADSVVRTQFPEWKIVKTVPGHMELEAETAGFRFVDDVVIETRPASGGGSVVEIRSRARLGRTDFGVNAKRIEDLKARIQAGGA